MAVAGVWLSLAEPLTDRGLGQRQLPGHLPDGLAGVRDALGDLGLVLRRKEPAGAWHLDSHLQGRALILGVHQTDSAGEFTIAMSR